MPLHVPPSGTHTPQHDNQHHRPPLLPRLLLLLLATGRRKLPLAVVGAYACLPAMGGPTLQDSWQCVRQGSNNSSTCTAPCTCHPPCSMHTTCHDTGYMSPPPLPWPPPPVLCCLLH